MEQGEILERVWMLLECGAADRQDDFHLATLATVNLQGAPEARTVVFRRLLREPFALCCHVDVRSPKAAEIRQNPQTAWLFYHAEEKLQLRIRGAATLHTADALADKQWQASQLISRRCYCGAAPGTESETASSGLPAFLTDRRPTEQETEELGRPNFAIVRAVIREMDVYELDAHGHRRVLFAFDDNGAVTAAQWLTP